MQEAWREHFTSVETLVASGTPAEAILHATAARGCGLVALVTRGRRGWRRWLERSTAEAVLRRASVPVLVARPDASCAHVRTVLVPLDGTRGSLRILPLVQRISATTGARVLLVHVLPEGATDRRAARVLQAACERLAQRGVRVNVVVRVGDPAEQVLDLVADARVPLVAMTTRGRIGLAHAVYGSVAEAVLRESAAPVLVLRTNRIEHRLGPRTGNGAKAAAHPHSILAEMMAGTRPVVRPPSWFAKV